MRFEDINNIEATYLDYRQRLETKKPISWLKSVVAFANTKGGHLIFGVTDKKHDFVGLDDPQGTSSKISEYISARIKPSPRYTITQISCKGSNKKAIDLEVSNGPNYPYYYVNSQDKKIFVRHGDRSEGATIMEQNNLLLKGMNQTFDSLPTNYKLSEVSFTLLAATFKKETGESFDPLRDLVSMGLVTQDNLVTNAGLLMCDQGYLKQSKIVCTRWKGTEKGSIDGDALDDQEFSEASLITLLSSAELFVRTNSKNPWTIRGMRRKENSDYPFRAIREVLVNALIHRDYQITGAEVHVDMFDDRMEISSPGGMMNGSRIQDLNLTHVPSMRRNEVISDIFSRLHYMGRRGSGIRRILNSYKQFEEKPDFYSDEVAFFVELPNRSVAKRIGQKSQLQNTKESTSDEKTPLQNIKESTLQVKSQFQNTKESISNEKTPLQGAELDSAILENWRKRGLNQSFRKETINKLLPFYKNYKFEYYFNRNALAHQLDISLNYASKIIYKCKQLGVIRMEKRGVYFFNDPFKEK